ncbi:uncharacterized protein BO97DRAFT_409528 [Aspergillus homomorphus CBS 101889]|uniref:Geranylgeranyl pyrophosphate synthetase n=1 Tax=Aspergillus homomorphus (strain CBS 101889) TaxID=1450537 RepID=A0A395HK28_ASPHC|nr:hypothetical protein BO97DRAFT_409528 [Aspergillus homomorphus CBS 101889]RAL06614.1 hypothetical protein BO97DRAFT_409528 [Aspergillus homomorphus CBS 101889]
MASLRIADIYRPKSTDLEAVRPSITNVKHLSSYNWIESRTPTIAVPGCPPLWSPPRSSKKVDKDSGLIYVAQNAARYPESPLEPLFRSLYIENPSYDICAVDLITDRNNLRKLLAFINPSLSKHELKPFTIEVEVTNDTAIFCRAETKAIDFIKPNEFKGYGHEFEKAFTTSQIAGSTGHHRIISYDFGGLKLIVRYETDAYIELPEPQGQVESENGDLLNMMGKLTLAQTDNPSDIPSKTKLGTRRQGKHVPVHSILEIKTRVLHKPIGMQEVLPQLWVSQTTNLVRAYHKGGVFYPPDVEDATLEINNWEKVHANDLQMLVLLIKDIIKVVRENDGSAVIKHDGRKNHLEVWTRDGSRMLPVDLYSKFHHESKSTQAIESDSRK